MAEDIKEIALNGAVTEALVLLEELKDLKVSISLELQATRDQRVAEHREWAAFMAELRGELDRIKADFRTDATLLHLIESPTGEKEWQGVRRKSSSRRSLRGRFASSTS